MSITMFTGLEILMPDSLHQRLLVHSNNTVTSVSDNGSFYELPIYTTHETLGIVRYDWNAFANAMNLEVLRLKKKAVYAMLKTTS